MGPSRGAAVDLHPEDASETSIQAQADVAAWTLPSGTTLHRYQTTMSVHVEPSSLVIRKGQQKYTMMKHFFGIFVFCWFFTVPAVFATSQTPHPDFLALPPQLLEEIQELTASDAAALDEFGRSVGVSGDTIVVGAFGGDGASIDSGSAYIFERNEGGTDNWGEVTKLVASDAAAGDLFGISVGISGDTVIVGAFRDDDACPAVSWCDSGSAYVFERNSGGTDNWGEVKKLTASDASVRSEFGFSLEVSGNTVIVGAPSDLAPAGSFSGSAYVFERDLGGINNWGEVTKLIASDPGAVDQFGFSVGVSGDTVIVGAVGNDDAGKNSGSAYVFQRDQGGPDGWGEVTKLTASNAQTRDHFGGSVAISGDSVIVGAYEVRETASGSAYVFERDLGGIDNWGEVTRLTASDAGARDRFGESVGISEDTVIVGALGDDDACPADWRCNSGSAYVFERDLGGVDNWGEGNKLTASDAEARDQFGFHVRISGNTMIAGTRLNDDAGLNSGSAYVFASSVIAADLVITKTDAADPVAAGNSLTYAITVQNLGPGEAQNVVVTETLPPEVTLVSTSGCGEDPAGVPTCTLGTIANNDFDDYAITVEVDPFTMGTIVNQASVNSSTPEALPGDETVSEATTVTLTPEQGLDRLMELVVSFDLGNGVENSLLASLENAKKKLTDNNPNNDQAACNNIDAFIAKVAEKLANGDLTEAQADELTQAAETVKDAAGC